MPGQPPSCILSITNHKINLVHIWIISNDFVASACKTGGTLLVCLINIQVTISN